MGEKSIEALIGACVLLAAAVFFVTLTRASGVNASGTYPLTAKFGSAEGIVVGSDVRLAGVKIGSVTALTLDQETYEATAKFAITDTVKIPDDSEAGVTMESLLGGAYVDIAAGGSDFMLVEGDEFINTQGAVSILNLLLRFANSSSSDE